jgi:uncharacterized protein YndB with AHSA1/START domain
MNHIRHETQIDIQATPEEVWQALTDPIKTRAYYYGTEILSDWQPGSRWTSESGDELYLEGELIEIDPPRRIVQTFHVTGDEPAAADAPSRVTWEVSSEIEGVTRVRVVHEGMGQATRDYTDGGWEHILQGLKGVAEAST